MAPCWPWNPLDLLWVSQTVSAVPLGSGPKSTQTNLSFQDLAQIVTLVFLAPDPGPFFTVSNLALPSDSLALPHLAAGKASTSFSPVKTLWAAFSWQLLEALMCTHRPPQAVSCHHFGAGCSCFSTAALHASLSLLHKLLSGFPSFQHFCISSPTTPLLHIAVQTSGYLLAHKLVESFHFCRQSTLTVKRR